MKIHFLFCGHFLEVETFFAAASGCIYIISKLDSSIVPTEYPHHFSFILLSNSIL
jgi:hypothetical protein